MRGLGRARRYVLMGALAIGVSAGLVACGSWTPPIVGRDCGAVHESYRDINDPSSYRVIGDPSAPEACLWQAWTRCQPATLVLTRVGVDTGETHTVTAQPVRGACGVTDAAQGYSAIAGRSDSLITTYTCADLTRAPDDGLVVRACGDEGNLVIPPMATPTRTPIPSGPTPSPT